LHPHPGAVSLLFPVADRLLDTADPVALSRLERPITLAYVGNQYDRDEAFGAYFAPAARTVPHLVAGKWPRTERWPHVRFHGRVAFEAVEAIHRTSLATVILLPDCYAAAGHVTQRIFEAVLAGCLPITPTVIHSVARFAPHQLHAATGADVGRICRWLTEAAGTADHSDLLKRCIQHLDLFRVSRQIAVLEQILHGRVVTAT
jgi:hypothetical protein